MTKESFLNEEMKRFKDLTREQKHVILDNCCDGICEVFFSDFWKKKETCGIHDLGIYRTKPKEYKKLDIPWEVIATVYNYAAMDENGDIYFYDVLPDWLPIHKEWSFNGSEVAQAYCLKLDTTDIVAEHSLTQRPEGEAK